MALINCPECNQQISDTAPTCPHCGFAQKPTTESSVINQPVTIESTNKIWKLMKILAVIVFLVGIVISRGDSYMVIASTIFAVLIFIVAKIGAWWTNK
jgi:hypothetical protein